MSLATLEAFFFSPLWIPSVWDICCCTLFLSRASVVMTSVTKSPCAGERVEPHRFTRSLCLRAAPSPPACRLSPCGAARGSSPCLRLQAAGPRPFVWRPAAAALWQREGAGRAGRQGAVRGRSAPLGPPRAARGREAAAARGAGREGAPGAAQHGGGGHRAATGRAGRRRRRGGRVVGQRARAGAGLAAEAHPQGLHVRADPPEGA